MNLTEDDGLQREEWKRGELVGLIEPLRFKCSH
jgi:hypothetical protein